MADMNVETLTNPRSNLPNTFTDIAAREVDFVTRFGLSWQALQEILGVVDPIAKQSGTRLVSYTASVTLTDGDVDPGNVIPYSKTAVVATEHDDVTIQKYAKAATLEDVSTYGAAIAIQRTDEAFLNELQSGIIDKFFTFISDDTYAMTGTYATFQKACAMAIGKVRNKFKSMRRSITKVVLFVNDLDAFEYLGDANITTQTAFGLDYVENFLGATLILSSDVEQGKVYATASENVVLYYVNPADSDFSAAGLEYRTDGVTNLIGFHAQGNYSTAVGESYAILGATLWAEFADGIAICTIDANP